MKLPSCKSCGLPVLELKGQFEKLDPFFIAGGTPPPETAGWWHTSCLVTSPVGPQWFAARQRNLRDVRGYVTIEDVPPWTVLKHPQRGDLLALSSSGELLSLTLPPSSRETEAGRIHQVVEKEFNLELDEEDEVRDAQHQLTTAGVFPVRAVLQHLGIEGRVIHPDALDGAVFRYDRAQRGHWTSHGIAARVEYGVFVPEELEKHVVPAAASRK